MHLLALPFAILATAPLLLGVHAHRLFPSDIRCPTGFHNSFVHNSYTYIAPLHKFTEITGSFFNLTWYGADINSTTGADNVVGATRSATTAGGTFHETLTAFTSHPGDVFQYTYHGKPVSFGGVHYSGCTETLRFESICGGQATYIDVLSHLCSDDKLSAYDGWYRAHLFAFEGLAAELEARVFEGDCPTSDVEEETDCEEEEV
ncbi:hypothetical protein FB45DRAFT_1004974 [Roridomyces roridus]|uniref:Uncharacterized protein n=1 Tax=Roridomyces roridus TaxID=1738132 RepID=A0AAD7FKN2_9AGAR|nr:hypothetical protein FB45DRAFT_1004974 [Roridomyces roridus]